MRHKSPFRVSIQGNILSFVQNFPHRGGGKRGDITGFSSKSAARMKDRLNALLFQDCQLVTLTYHENIVEWSAARKDWEDVRRRFFREFGKVSLFWVREFQQRGAIHFHVLLLDCAEACADGLIRLWHARVAPDDTAHEKYGGMKSDRRERDPRRAVAYFAKYASKTMLSGPSEGRKWGYNYCRFAERLVLELPPQDFYDLLFGASFEKKATRFSVGANFSTKIYCAALGREDGAVLKLAEIRRRALQIEDESGTITTPVVSPPTETVGDAP